MTERKSRLVSVATESLNEIIIVEILADLIDQNLNITEVFEDGVCSKSTSALYLDIDIIVISPAGCSNDNVGIGG